MTREHTARYRPDEQQPRRHDRRGQGRHGRREDPAPERGRHHRRRVDRRDSRPREGATGGACLMPGLFIDVEVSDEIAGDAEYAKKLTDGCPVDIYSEKAGKVEIVEENLDECIL